MLSDDSETPSAMTWTLESFLPGFPGPQGQQKLCNTLQQTVCGVERQDLREPLPCRSCLLPWAEVTGDCPALCVACASISPDSHPPL